MGQGRAGGRGLQHKAATPGSGWASPAVNCTTPGVPGCLGLWLLTHEDGPHWLDKNLLPTYLPCLALGPPCKHPVEARMNPGQPQLPAVVPSSSYAGCLGAQPSPKQLGSLGTARQAHFSLHQALPYLRAASQNLPSGAGPAVHFLRGFGKLHLLSVAVSLSMKW